VDNDKTFQPMALKFSFNVCELVKDESPNIMFKLLLGVEQFIRNLISQCPIEKGTMIVVPDQIRPSVPRKGQGPMIPSGYYRFTFDFRTTEPNGTLAMIAVEFQYRGFW
jgi:hypothetical protein